MSEKYLGPMGRRGFVGAAGAALFTVRGLFAEELQRPTPWMTEGPFYPDRLPLDKDNDLIIVGDSTTPAVGEVTHLAGQILDTAGKPIKDAVIEIWQCDANAVYLHTADSRRKEGQQDKNFQGYGQFTTSSEGGYRFRTIKPVPYPGRPAPHIHIKVSSGGRELLTTQLFIRGHEGNTRDGIFRNTRSQEERDMLTADFKPMADSRIGELACSFNLVIGATPDDREIGRPGRPGPRPAGGPGPRREPPPPR